MVRDMFAARKAEVTTCRFKKVTGVRDMDSATSVYLTLLGEDIILEESPAGRADQRRVSFVYEEFMEYVLALGVLLRMLVRPGKTAEADHSPSSTPRSATSSTR